MTTATKTQKLKAAVNLFMRKASKRNEPLEAFRSTDEFKRFEQLFRDGIKKQAKWAATHLSDIPGIDEQTSPENSDVLEARIQSFVKDMPAITAYVSQAKVFSYFKSAFVYSIEATLLRLGVRVKAVSVPFNLENKHYLATLQDQANYLLNRSSIDNTTKKQIIAIIQDAKLVDNATIDEMADAISTEFESISENRAFVIANTETNQAMSKADEAFMRENGVQTKVWVTAGANICPLCEDNALQGEIGVNDEFDSGDTSPPAHPSCECYIESGEIDLNSINIWDGS